MNPDLLTQPTNGRNQEPPVYRCPNCLTEDADTFCSLCGHRMEEIVEDGL